MIQQKLRGWWGKKLEIYPNEVTLCATYDWLRWRALVNQRMGNGGMSDIGRHKYRGT